MYVCFYATDGPRAEADGRYRKLTAWTGQRGLGHTKGCCDRFRKRTKARNMEEHVVTLLAKGRGCRESKPKGKNPRYTGLDTKTRVPPSFIARVIVSLSRVTYVSLLHAHTHDDK